MALRYKSYFNYGLEITMNNRSIDFKTSGGGSEKQATLRVGFYALTSLSEEIVRAMSEADNSTGYAVTITRGYSGGTGNRITIGTTGSYLSLLFLTGTRNASSICSLIGFLQTDRTGSLSYQGESSAGTVLVTEQIGYNWVPPDIYQEVQGSVLISASGVKETIVFNIMEFFSVDFKYEPSTKLTDWNLFFRWAIKQRLFEFTPEYPYPNSYYECTLEKTSQNGKGLGYRIKEMLPSFPFFYETDTLTLRRRVAPSTFIY